MGYTLGEASKVTGISKPTLSRAIKSGRISAKKSETGVFVIEPVELHRLYPPKQAQQLQSGTNETNVTTQDNSLLQAQLDAAREMIDELRGQRDAWQSQAEKLALSDHRPPSASFWGRLRGR